MAVGVLAAVVITTRRYERLGGNPSELERILVWVIVLGFLGARAAFVSTRLSNYSDRPWAVFALWEGGIAIFGGLVVGGLVAVLMLRRSGQDFWTFADSAALGLPIAQAIARWGNYVNQELFGTPTDLPWALEIDPINRPAEYASFETFHPTFLYESLWNLVVVVPMLLWVERRFELRRGVLFGVYLTSYGVIRFLNELIRTDTTFRFLGLSRNAWTALGAITLGVGLAVHLARAGKAQPDRAASGS